MLKRIFALYIIPINTIDGIWQSILSDKPNIARVDEFLDFFNNTYFEGKFPIQLWNHYDTIRPRTNNHLEGYNLKIKKTVAVAHPDIFKAITILQNEEVIASINYHKEKLGDKIPLRRKKEIEKDGKIITLKTMLEDGEIT